jgi:hypothetical protein
LHQRLRQHAGKSSGSGSYLNAADGSVAICGWLEPAECGRAQISDVAVVTITGRRHAQDQGCETGPGRQLS